MHVVVPVDNEIDNLISKRELEAAIQIWKIYLKNKSFAEERLAQYGTDKSGKLELNQLKALLTDFSYSKKITDGEVRAVMEEAGWGQLNSMATTLRTATVKTVAHSRFLLLLGSQRLPCAACDLAGPDSRAGMGCGRSRAAGAGSEGSPQKAPSYVCVLGSGQGRLRRTGPARPMLPTGLL